MPAVSQHQVETSAYLGTHIACGYCGVGQAGPYIQAGQYPRRGLNPGDRLTNDSAQRPKQLGLPNPDTLLGAEHPGLVVFELGGDVSLRGSEGLPSLIIRRDPGGV